MRKYPVYLDLEDRIVLVAGGGSVAQRKVQGLLDTGAKITLIAPEATEQIAAWAQAHLLTWINREVSPEDVSGAALVFAATDDSATNALLLEAAAARDILANCATDGEGTFDVPATLQRGKLQVAASTDGASPALARKIRLQLEEQYGPGYEQALETIAQLRELALQRIDDPAERRAFLKKLADDEVLARLLDPEQPVDATRLFEEMTTCPSA